MRDRRSPAVGLKNSRPSKQLIRNATIKWNGYAAARVSSQMTNVLAVKINHMRSARLRDFAVSGGALRTGAYTHEITCGISKIAVNEKSTMKSQSHATRL